MNGLSPQAPTLAHFLAGQLKTLEIRLIIGAIIDCSLANHLRDYSISALQNSNNAAWKAATDGRILHLLVTHPGLPFQWEYDTQYIVVYQHVAKAANMPARTLLRDTLGVLTTAGAEGKRTVFLGDFNAAPPRGGWCYANGRRAVHEDRAWILANNLTEVLPGLLPKPTWRPSEGPQLAVLERILVSHQDKDTLPIEKLVHWSHSHTEFDHALITHHHSSVTQLDFNIP